VILRSERLERRLSRVWSVVQRNWQRLLQIREKFRFREEAIHLLLASAVGIIGGLVNVVFYLVIDRLQALALRAPGDLVDLARMMDWWQRLLIPAVGGLGAGLALHWGLRVIGQQGSTNLLEVVAVGDGRLPFRSSLIKALSSLVSISTGASIGREGAITQMTATLASKAGQFARWPPYRLRLLLACGAAAGIAAA
jgi:CIC family chloride channel protein